MVVTYGGKEYTCAQALKGADWVRLVDVNGCNIATFDGVKNFSLFTISDGSWTTCTNVDEYPFAVVLPDGSVEKSAVTKDDIGTFSYLISTGKGYTSTTFVTAQTTLYRHTYTVDSYIGEEPGPPPVAYIVPQYALRTYIQDEDGYHGEDGAEAISNNFWFWMKDCLNKQINILGCFAYYQKRSNGIYGLFVDVVFDRDPDSCTYDFYPDIFVTSAKKTVQFDIP